MKSKKIISLILVLAFMLSFAVVPASAEGETEVSLTVSSPTANVDDIVLAQIYVKGTQAWGQLAYALTWDRTQFTLWHKTLNQAATSYAGGTLDNPVWQTATYYNEDEEIDKPMFSKMGSKFDVTNPTYGLIATLITCDQIVGSGENATFVEYDIPVPDTNTPFLINTMRFKCIATASSSDFKFVTPTDGRPYDPDNNYGIYYQSEFGVNDTLVTPFPTAQINGAVPDQEQDAPTGLTGNAPSVKNATDGSITGIVNPSAQSGAAAEYSSDGGANYSDVTGNSITGLGEGTYLVRYKAITGWLVSPATSVTVDPGELPVPAAPVIVGVDPTVMGAADGKVTGVDTTMEYQVNSGGWTACTGIEITGLSANDVVEVRVAAVADVNQAGEIASVTINEGPLPIPAAPTGLAGVYATNDFDLDGKITGTTTALEYSTDGGANYTPCTGTSILNLAGNTAVKVRVAAVADVNQAGVDANITVPASPKVADIDLAVNASNANDNNYSTIIAPSELNTNVQYEYAFLDNSTGEIYDDGPWGTWFDINAAGVGKWTVGIINGHVTIPLTYYYAIKSVDTRVVIRDKNNPQFTKTLQPMATVTSSGNNTSVTNNSMAGFGASPNGYLSSGSVAPGTLASGSGSGTPSTRHWPVGVPFAYIIAPIGSTPTYDNPGWVTTIQYYTSATTKASLAGWEIYPQNPNGDMMYYKTLTALAAGTGFTDATIGEGYLASARWPSPLGTVAINDDKISAPPAPSGISDSGTDATVTLSGLKPYQYEYVLSDADVAPSVVDFTGATPVQTLTGSASFAFDGQKFMYIRTVGGTIMEGSPASKVALHDYDGIYESTGITGYVTKRGTVSGANITFDAKQLTMAVAPALASSSASYTVTVDGVARSTFKSAGGLLSTIFDLNDNGKTVVFTVTDGALAPQQYTFTVDTNLGNTDISSYVTKRGTVSGAEIVFDAKATNMAVAPVLASPTAKYTVTVDGVARNICNSGGGLYSTILTLADDGKTVVFTVTDANVAPQQYTFTVVVPEGNTAISSYVVKRGTVEGSNITFAPKCVTMAVAPVLASPTAKYTVTVDGVARNTCNSGGGLYSTIFTLADVGKTVVFTVTDVNVAPQQFTFTVVGP